MNNSSSPLSIPKSLVASLRVLTVITAVLMTATRELDLRFTGLFMGLFLVGFLTEKSSVLSQFLGRFQTLFAVGLLFLVGFDFFVGGQSFLICVAHFLLSLQGVRLLSIRTVRDSLGSLLLSSMMLLSASTLSVEWWFFVGLILFLPTLVWGLILSTLILDHQNVEVLRINLKDNKELGFVRAGLSVLGFPDEREPVWRHMLPVARNSTLIAFVTSAIFCAGMFVVFPRFNFQGFRGQFLQPVHKSGFTSQVDLQKESAIFEDDSIVMRIQMDPKERPRWSGYLRGTSLSYFDGQRWSRDPRNKASAVYGVRGGFHLPVDPAPVKKPFRLDLYLESMETPLLFVPPGIITVAIDRPSLTLGPDGSLERSRNDTWRIHYQAESQLDDSRSHSVLIMPRLKMQQEPILAAAKILPKEFDSALLRPLLDSWVGNRTNVLDIAEVVARTLPRRYAYSLDLSGVSKGRPVEDFLLTSKKGNCEYFASAMCVLLRMKGIPARMATGFLAREWNSRGNYYVVRMKDAHAWVEAYINGQWRRYDPTPRTQQEDNAGFRPVQTLREMMDLLNLKWNRYILSYDLERQVGFIKQVGFSSSQIRMRWKLFSLDKKKFTFPRTVSRSQGYILAGGVLMIIFWGAYTLLKTKNSHRQIWFYRDLIKTLRRKGFRKSSGLTLREFLDSIQDPLGPHISDARFVLETYYQVRFGGAPSLPSSQILRLKDSLRRLSR